jgi:hypothetical protein
VTGAERVPITPEICLKAFEKASNEEDRDGMERAIAMWMSNEDVVSTGVGEGTELFRKTANTGAFEGLSEPMQLRHVQKVAKEAGIGLDGIKIKIVRDPELIGKGICGYASPRGNVIELYPDAFTNTESLVKTLGHERTHIYQVKTFGSAVDTTTLIEFEKGAWGSESSWWDFFNRKGK